ncbi:MAG: iron-containing alcohol dehydrogenase [Pirellulales bacterium]
MRTTWTFHTVGELIFGRGAADQLGDIARRLRAKRAMIITDVALVKAGLADKVRAPLIAADITVGIFDGGAPEPPVAVAEVAVAAARDFRPHVLIGLGGGSNMDLAKIAATILAHGGSPRDYAGEDTIPGEIWPLICVPTTAGTGSEVSAAAVLTDTEAQNKFGILSNYLRPHAAVVDPILSQKCPAKVTADSGIDALTHAIEAYTAIENEQFPLPPGERSVYQGRHPLGDLLAEQAIELVGRHLRTAVLDGGNLAAREGMALAATLAGMAFSNVGVALVHALEYPIGGATHCSHGAGNGLLLPHVMRFNKAVREDRMARIGQLLGAEATADGAIAAIERLNQEIGIPRRLRDLGAREDQLPQFAAKAITVKRILRVNPRPVSEDDALAILRAAY